MAGAGHPPPPCGRQLSPPCARPMSMQDWYPLATRAPGFRAGVHYAPSNRGRLACVLHIAQGGYQSSIDYLRAKGLSSHFIISEGGSVTQMVPLSASAYANGLSWDDSRDKWICPHSHTVHPAWQRLSPPTNPNFTTISVEHAGFNTKPRPAAQMKAGIDLLRWLAVEWPTLGPYVPGYTLIGHSHLDDVDKAFCPGEHFDFAAIAAQANASIGTYRFKTDQSALSSNDPRVAHLAPSAQAWRVFRAGEVVEVDDVTNGFAHIASGVGFVPLAVLELI